MPGTKEAKELPENVKDLAETLKFWDEHTLQPLGAIPGTKEHYEGLASIAIDFINGELEN